MTTSSTIYSPWRTVTTTNPYYSGYTSGNHISVTNLIGNTINTSSSINVKNLHKKKLKLLL